MEKIDIKKVLYSLNVGSEDFWMFMEGKVKSLPALVHDFGWGCFYFTDDNDILYDIKVLVPNIVDTGTLLVNIHEFTHAYELYGKIGLKYENNVLASENLAKSKEEEYLKLVKSKENKYE